MKKYVIFLCLIVILLCGCNNDDVVLENQNNVINTQQTEDLDKVNIHNEIEKSTSGETEKKELDIEINEEILETKVVEVSSNSLSNKTNAWGFRRMKNNIQPEFSSMYINVLNNYEGIYVGNSGEKNIYLTFDEGYENGYTDDILDTLKEKNVTAVFFVTMPYVKRNKELVQRMVDEGHIIGNHTVNHPSMPEVIEDEKLKKEIMDLHDYVKENFNYEMTFLRPPKGEYSERTVKISLDLGYRTVLWSSAYDDWDVNKQGRLDYARGMILNNLHNGCVMLLHAVSKDNTELLGEIIDETRNKGYEFVSLEEFEY